jgi:hypothetical protein
VETIGHGWSDSSSVSFEALARIVRPQMIDDALTRARKHSIRIRKLPACGVVWLIIGIGLFAEVDIPSIWRQVVGTLASLWNAVAELKPACKGAIAKARKQMGARVLRLLFRSVSSPVADMRTRGAFYRGLRVMALDGQSLKLPDTPVNAKAFGRPSTRRAGQEIAAGYPQLQLLRLIETGTHVAVEAIIKPCRCNEYPYAIHFLDVAPVDSLTLADRGFYGYTVLKHASDTRKHVLVRVASYVKFEIVKTLCDGSSLARIYPTDRDRRRQTNGLIIRVIRYTIDDPNRVGHQIEHRLATTLLDEQTYPAIELVVLYHRRWEIEIDNDELTTHQLLNRPVELRSRTPVGCVQELYGILIAHNAIRMLMHESACDVNIDPRELSFIHAVRVLRETIPLMRAAQTEQLPRIYRAMLTQIASTRLPPREDRINPRVVKSKRIPYARKYPDQKGQQVKPFDKAFVLLK